MFELNTEEERRFIAKLFIVFVMQILFVATLFSKASAEQYRQWLFLQCFMIFLLVFASLTAPFWIIVGNGFLIGFLCISAYFSKRFS